MIYSQYLKVFRSLYKDLIQLQNCMPNNPLFMINGILEDFYKTNNIQWKDYLIIKDNNKIEKQYLSLIKNLEVSIFNIPANINSCITNFENSSFIILSGSINKYTINNDFITNKKYLSGNIGNIYNKETYMINTKEDTLMLNISVIRSVFDYSFESNKII
jgi:hypothetical protein